MAEHSCGAINLSSENSSKVMSVKSLMPWVHECLPMLWFLMEMSVSQKILKR